MNPCENFFVYGALRSGSTLLRLMINAHPALHCPGEVDYLFDYVSYDTKTEEWVFDKEAIKSDRIFLGSGLRCPDTSDGPTAVREMIEQLRARDPRHLVMMIHRNLSAVIGALSDCKVVHLLRDPRDVAASSIGMGWAGNVYYGADHWIATENTWTKYSPKIPQASILTLRFEDLIADTLSSLMNLCQFYGVPYSTQMLEYHKASTYDPVDPKLSSQWKTKRSDREIALIELRVGKLLKDRGFEASGKAPAKLTPVQKLQLWLDNKVQTWLVRIHRYGFVDSVSVAAARRLGLSHFAKPAQLRIDERVKRYLK